MAKAVTLKNQNNEEVYPVTDISLVNGNIAANRITDGAVTAAKVDFSTFGMAAIALYHYCITNCITGLRAAFCGSWYNISKAMRSKQLWHYMGTTLAHTRV